MITMNDLRGDEKTKKAVDAAIKDTRHRLRQLMYVVMVDTMRREPDLDLETFIETVDNKIHQHEKDHNYLIVPLRDI